MENFEGQFVGYMFNQAKMPFFRVTGYTRAEGEMKEFVERAADYEKTMKKIADRVKRSMRVPNTWKKKINDAQSMVMVLEDSGLAYKGWVDEYYRVLRFLEVYKERDFLLK